MTKRKKSKQVSNLGFYTQSASTVKSGRERKKKKERKIRKQNNLNFNETTTTATAAAATTTRNPKQRSTFWTQFQS